MEKLLGRKIPKDEEVSKAVEEVIRRHKKVVGLTKLCSLVKKELKKVDERYTISESRIKKLVIGLKSVEVKSLNKKGEEPQKCPICGSDLVEVYGRNLLGKKLLLGYRCPNCGFEAKVGKTEPRVYVFLWKG